MSAFLGPIHVKMYDRIVYQDSMAQKILDLAVEKGWGSDLAKEVNAKAPAASRQPLEDIIDKSNIHGWLSAAVAGCERRFAMIVSNILADHPERCGELQNLMSNMGREYALPQSMNAEMAYEAIHDILLDGMPCDFPFTNVESSADTVTWQVANCPHAQYWVEAHSDADIYYQLRDAWMNGALEASEISHHRVGPQSHILKKERRNG